jgi:DNA-directed RNA polymerase subunit RPC12/RpoP
MIYICGDVIPKIKENLISDLIRCRESGYRITYKKGTKRLVGLMLNRTGEFRGAFIRSFAPLMFLFTV